MDSNLHAGHRQRMMNRFLNSPDSLSDHEKLEIMLFSIVPRHDTNALAHTLINVFGSLKNVFNASPKELSSIKGVGDRVATQICVVGKIIDSVIKESASTKVERFSSFENNKKFIARHFEEGEQEKFIIFLLDDKFKCLSHMEFKNKSNFAVKVEVPELVQALAVIKPNSLIIAHNHPSGNATPSETDDFTTKKLNILCEIHGIALLDHVIVGKNDFFSYHVEGRMDYIRKASDVSTVLKEVDRFITE